MRKAIAILALTVVTVLASAGDAFAQRRGRGWGVTIGNGGVRLDSGSNYYGQGAYGQYPSSSYGQYPYSTNSRYYSPRTQYYYTDPVVRQAYYYEPAVAQQSATVLVQLPRADAKVWFDGSATTQQGMERSFYTPPLDPGGTFTYTIRARWLENGQTIDREQSVNVRPGQTVTVAFRAGAGENLQTTPRPK